MSDVYLQTVIVGILILMSTFGGTYNKFKYILITCNIY